MDAAVTGSVGEHYRRSRRRLGAILASADDAAWEQAVPACPGWRVHDVVAHLAGVIEDGMAGRLDGPPDDALTADEVRRYRDVPHGELLDRWNELGPLMEAAITDAEIWPAAFDVLSHEHDVRGALGRPGDRQIDSVGIATTRLIESLELPAVLHVQTEFGVASTAPVDGPELHLKTTAFEVLRLRLGRRSRQQVLDLDWSSPPPTDVLDALFVFGPRPDALIE